MVSIHQKLLVLSSSQRSPIKVLLLYTSYTHSQIESFESNYVEKNPNQVHLSLKANRIKRIETEILIYDVLDMIGALGGSLGLYLGFSFFDLISKYTDLIYYRIGISRC